VARENQDISILYAPNVHTGGGYVLLNKLLSSWDDNEPLILFCDDRARNKLTIKKIMSVRWVKPNIWSRVKAEFRLFLSSSRQNTVLCFHGLPPIFPNKAEVKVFLQNRNYLGVTSFSQYSIKTKIRLSMEIIFARVFRHRVDEYIVQTPTMKHELQHWMKSGFNKINSHIVVYPFSEKITLSSGQANKSWDFVYVADGEAHKNHRRLLSAWCELSLIGLKPTLALTLGDWEHVLREEIDRLIATYDIKIINLGHIDHEEVLEVYRQTGALIFPSFTESFGLPLVEADAIGLPIVAAERDFVRDVCQPKETFDPLSVRSIVRAICRFMGASEEKLTINSPGEFNAYALRKNIYKKKS